MSDTLLCPKCGSEIELEHEGGCYCKNENCENGKDSFETCEKKEYANCIFGTTSSDIALQWQNKAKHYAKENSLAVGLNEDLKDKVKELQAELDRLNCMWDKIGKPLEDENIKLIAELDRVKKINEVDIMRLIKNEGLATSPSGQVSNFIINLLNLIKGEVAK